MKLYVCFLAIAPLLAQDVSGERIRAHVKFLASDLLEGRGVGVRGGDLATEYIASQLALVGAKPAGENGTYFQKVPLVGVATEPDATMRAGSHSLKWLDEFVGVNRRQQAQAKLDAQAVFVGHGIVAPEYQWDDYKDVDVKGKIVFLFTNEPESTDPKFFGGRALTYYGRWTYKFEQALRKGAAGAVIIHTTPTAGYGWEVVRNSWGREEPYVKLGPNDPELSFAAWITQEAAKKILAPGHTVDELLKTSESRSFRPIPLGFNVRLEVRSKIRAMDTRNVVGIIPGSDPQVGSETVIFSAHWDHLGVGTPVNGDSIYNGAIDNATGCAIILEIARAWSALPRKPRRSALFLAVTAEEGGLRGSEYYGRNPLVPASKTAAAFNYDALPPFGRTTDVVVAGAERTTMWPMVQQIATRFGLTIKPDPRPEQGSYYRSDHFSFARAGIPAFSIRMGNDFAGKTKEFGDEIFREYNTRNYHQPSDEYKDDWDFAGLEEMAKFGFVLGMETANQQRLPDWNKGDEFQRK